MGGLVVPTVGLDALEKSNNLFGVPGIESRVLQQVAQCCTELRKWAKPKVRVTVAVTAAAFVVNITSITTIIIWHHFADPSLPAVWCFFMRPARHRLRPARRGVL
jgi:hypothetical protein